MDHKVKIALVVGGVGLVGVLYLRNQAAAAAAAAQSSDSSSIPVYTTSTPVSLGASSGGAYAGSSGDLAGSTGVVAPSYAEQSTNVTSFASLLQGLIGSATQYATQQQQATQAAVQQNAATVTNTVSSVVATTTPAQPAPAPAPAAPADMSLSQISGGRIVENQALASYSKSYADAWTQAAAANAQRFGSGWNVVSAGANQDVFNGEIRNLGGAA